MGVTTAQMILVAGPYRSGTDDDPAKMAANVRLMEGYALPLFQPAMCRFSENGSRCPSSPSPGRAGLGMTRSTRFSIRSPNDSSHDAMRSSAWAALRREPT